MTDAASSARLPELEWAHRSAAGTLVGLDWVEPGLDREAPATRVLPGEGGRRFRGANLAAQLPVPLADAILAATEAGETPLLDGVARVLAPAEWMILARTRLWTPVSPAPALLARLVEAYGIGVELHRGQPERLARLAARLPAWHPMRGRLECAIALLNGALDEPLDTLCSQISLDGMEPAAPPLADEVLSARSLDWWRARAEPGATPQYRIERGLLRFQSTGPRYGLLREDVLVAPTGDAVVPGALLRLLPVWTSLRVVESSP